MLRRTLIPGLLLVLVALACRLDADISSWLAPTATLPTRLVAPPPTGPITPPPTVPGPPTAGQAGGAAVNPGPTPVPATPTPAGQPLQYQNVRLIVPPALASWGLQGFQAQFGYSVDALETGTLKTIPIVRFATSPQDTFCDRGCIDIIPVAQAQTQLGRFAFPPDGQGAGVLLKARVQTLIFQNGQGTRALEVHGQGLQPVNNQDLRYVFRGYTQDGRYAVYAIFPVQASGLPSHPDPAQNTAPNVFMSLPALDNPQAIEQFNQQAIVHLNQLPPTGFTPSLAALDALLQSLSIGP